MARRRTCVECISKTKHALLRERTQKARIQEFEKNIPAATTGTGRTSRKRSGRVAKDAVPHLDPAGEAAKWPKEEEAPREHQLDDVIYDHLQLVPEPHPKLRWVQNNRNGRRCRYYKFLGCVHRPTAGRCYCHTMLINARHVPRILGEVTWLLTAHSTR